MLLWAIRRSGRMIERGDRSYTSEARTHEKALEAIQRGMSPGVAGPARRALNWITACVQVPPARLPDQRQAQLARWRSNPVFRSNLCAGGALAIGLCVAPMAADAAPLAAPLGMDRGITMPVQYGYGGYYGYGRPFGYGYVRPYGGYGYRRPYYARRFYGGGGYYGGGYGRRFYGGYGRRRFY